MDIYLFVLLNFYLSYQLYCCDYAMRFTSQMVAYELTHPINVQFLLLNRFTAYWMCKNISETVQRKLLVSQVEISTIFPTHKLLSYFGCEPYFYGEEESGRAYEELIL